MTTLALPFATGIGWQGHLSAEEGLAEATACGCTHWYIDLGREGEAPEQWSPGRVAALCRAAAGHGLRPIVHGSLANPLACEDPLIRGRAVAAAAREVELASRLGAPLILHASSYYPGRSRPLDREQALDAYVASLRELGPPTRGVPLWAENLPKLEPGHLYESVMCEPREYRRVLAAVPGLALVLDVGHASVNAGPDGLVFEDFAARVAALCLSDNDGFRDEHAPLGRGRVDFHRVLEQVRRACWRGVVVFETRGATPAEGTAYLRGLVPPATGSGPVP